VRIAVLGPGGVGGFLTGALERAGTPVTLLAREETAAVLARDGLRVRSVLLDDAWTARPRVASVTDDPLDVLVVATKAVGLEAALDRVRGPVGLVVPLLNGLDHLGLLRARFPAVVASTIRITADRPEPGVIEQTSPVVRVDFASDGGQPDARELAAAVEGAGIPVRVGEAEAQVMWSKLVRLSALACVTAASDLPLGAVRDDPAWSARLDRALAEGAAVAAADGARVDPVATRADLDAMPPGSTSSLQRDVRAGRPSELDAIAGAVLRAGKRHGIPTPETAWLRDAVAARERAHGGATSPAAG
jgi:2-dehydropantoate 2-reductase